jgi:hypothetical protein
MTETTGAQHRPTNSRHSTEITVIGGERCRVEGDASEVERLIIAAARGSIMELVWLVEAGTGTRLAFNPESIVMLRALDS